MKKFTLNLKKCVFFSVCLSFGAFSGFKFAEEPGVNIQQFLLANYDLESQGKQIKRFEINVTNTGFCRYRRIFANGKEEYFAFNMSRFKSLDFYGNASKGDLYIRTKNDDVIVQTRNDRSGEVDSTSTFVIIPLKNIDVEQLNALSENFTKVGQLLDVNIR